jgi:ATP-dependent RNA helicase DeaD
MPERVRSLSRVFLTEPEYVTLSEGQLAPQEIEHFYMITTAQEKDANLIRMIEFEDPESAIIFCNTKSDVRYVTSYLQRRGFDADQISGDLTQAAREEALRRIKQGNLRFLVATDVAARGIDLSHVIGYSSPDSPEVYVHRTGRTGRAGKAGVAISLVSGLDIGNFRYLQQVNKIDIKERKVPKPEELLERLRDRLMVKVEQEVRALPERERRFQTDRFVPIVKMMSESKEGQRDLAAICAAYMKEHRPETQVTEAKSPEPSSGNDSPRDDRGGRRSKGRGRRPRQRR